MPQACQQTTDMLEYTRRLQMCKVMSADYRYVRIYQEITDVQGHVSRLHICQNKPDYRCTRLYCICRLQIRQNVLYQDITDTGSHVSRLQTCQNIPGDNRYVRTCEITDERGHVSGLQICFHVRRLQVCQEHVRLQIFQACQQTTDMLKYTRR